MNSDSVFSCWFLNVFFNSKESDKATEIANVEALRVDVLSSINLLALTNDNGFVLYKINEAEKGEWKSLEVNLDFGDKSIQGKSRR